MKIYGRDARESQRPLLTRAVHRHEAAIAMIGDPDPDHVSTSYIERSNLTLRMANRRFTRLTNAFSKKLANHCHMVALYTVWYNFVKMHKTLKMTPALAANVSTRSGRSTISSPWSTSTTRRSRGRSRAGSRKRPQAEKAASWGAIPLLGPHFSGSSGA